MTLLPGLRGSGADRSDALRVAGRTLSAEALLGCANAVADRIRGARAVAVEAEPHLETMVGIVGAVQAGVPVVPLPPGAEAAERHRILRESRADVLLGPTTCDATLPLVPVDLRDRSWATHPDPLPASDAVILYTGGVGGLSRGVRISHRAIAADLDLLAAAWRWSAEDVLVQGAPLFRAYGLVVGLLGALRVGSRFVHLDRHATAGPPGTIYLALPRQWARIAGDAARARTLSRARMLVSGDAPLAPAVGERLRVLTSHHPVEGYGTTETLVVLTGPAGAPGTPLPGVQTRVLDHTGRPVAADGDAVGELSVRSPTTFSGYADRPGSAPPADGWHPTGDLATVDPAGRHRILGPGGTGVVRCGGRHVPTGQVEEVLLAHPGVHEVAVVGAPHRTLGEQVVAYVVAAAGLTAQALVDHVGRLLSAAARPRRVHFVDELPRSAQGRVRKSLLIRRSAHAPVPDP
ncbi:AMP-binding protein [Micromonospora robiginosa]|uniref:AMP-binding protein n=1 Tax=Micromonospora robiginosa TaxID=2749844 RepID=A0A7L6B254_9ACTN|nr:AMP-binding protein [Micromonospora ferruginea]QLQ35720.1 AMP-binding protein [Micromonospora ferruginea]